MTGMARAPRKIVEKPDEGLKQLDDLRRQATDLGVARKALDDAVSMTRGLWISFISLSAYLMVAVGAVTHVDLFLENPLQLPLVGVKVPLVVFFWLAPILYIIIHSYLLLNLKLMSDNVRDWLARLEQTLAKESNAQERQRIAQAHKLSLPNFFPVQMLAGPRINQVGIMRWGLASAVMLTIIVAPILLLFLVQAQFLPYHHETVTWVHRFSILADIAILWYFWPRIRGVHKFKERWFLKIAGIFATASLLILSIFVATFPGESFHGNSVSALIDQIFPQDRSVCKARQAIIQNVVDDEMCLISVTEALFDGAVDEVRGLPRSIFANRIVIVDRDFSEQNADKKPGLSSSLSLRGRHLEHAVLARTGLQMVDFTGAHLNGAIFDGAELQGATFECAYTGEEVGQIRIQGFGSACTDLIGASLDEANLTGASMNKAKLQGASLIGSILTGAHLDGASLQGSLIIQAELQGAILTSADLQGSNLQGSILKGAIIDDANLNGAIMTDSDLRGASMNFTKLNGTQLSSADLSGAVVINSFFWRADGVNKIILTDATQINASTMPFSKQDYAYMVKDISDGQAPTRIKAIILERLSILDPSKPKTETGVNSEFWSKASSRFSEDSQVRFLAAVACSEDGRPYVTRTMLGFSEKERGTIYELDEKQRTALATVILNTREGKNCLGLDMIDPPLISQLEDWAPNWMPSALPQTP
jgi:uncharacterized protein YjbI with pentapeptide repeats